MDVMMRMVMVMCVMMVCLIAIVVGVFVGCNYCCLWYKGLRGTVKRCFCHIPLHRGGREVTPSPNPRARGSKGLMRDLH